jgi:hypothetical protein
MPADVLDWLEIFGICFLISFVGILAFGAILWFSFKPQERGPRRIVDVRNRGHTRIMMPDGSIK